jgi:hypothetical protein
VSQFNAGLGNPKPPVPFHSVRIARLHLFPSAEEAQSEFQRELVVLRSLCLKLLGDQQRVA